MPKPMSGTSIILQSLKSGLKGHVCSLHLQNEEREPKFGIWVYQRLVTMSKSRSRCQTPVRNLQHPPKPQIRNTLYILIKSTVLVEVGHFLEHIVHFDQKYDTLWNSTFRSTFIKLLGLSIRLNPKTFWFFKLKVPKFRFFFSVCPLTFEISSNNKT